MNMLHLNNSFLKLTHLAHVSFVWYYFYLISNDKSSIVSILGDIFKFKAVLLFGMITK